MIEAFKSFVSTRPAEAGLALVAALAAITLGGAWYLQLVEGLFPCPLCLEQRWPWYVGGALALVMLGLPSVIARTKAWQIWALPALAVVMAWGAWRGIYHVGVEHHWWGSSCTGGGNQGPISIDDLNNLDALEVGVPCDAIQWEFLGITLAGFNTMISLGVMAALIYLFFMARAQAKT